MKKKIILILSMLALCVCVFAISVSANAPSIDEMSGMVYAQVVISNDSSVNYGKVLLSLFDSASIEGTFVNTAVLNEVIKYDLNFSDIQQKGLYNTLVDFGIEITNTRAGDYSSDIELIFNNIESFIDYSYSNGITEFKSSEEYTTTLSTKYDEGIAQGKIDGVTEYKESEEYTTALDTKYQAGVNDFKDSAEYKSSLNNAESNGYTLGMSAGKEAFKASDEYQNVLENQYTLGFNDGTVSAEENAQPNVFGILFGVAGIGLLALSIVFVIFSAKKKVRSKR